VEKRPWVLASPPLAVAGAGIAIRLKVWGDDVSHPYWSLTSNILLCASALWIAVLVVDWVRSRRGVPAAPALDGPRRLNAVQSAQIIQALHGRVGRLIICSYAVAPDSTNLAEDFAAAFRKAGWQVDVSMQPTKPRIAPPTGIAIELPGNNAPQPDPKMSDDEVRSLFRGAMNAAGISVDIRSRTEIWNWAQCCIVIGARP